ncbi:phosphate system positive regulatory protein pho81, partial [Ascosphaera atra]
MKEMYLQRAVEVQPCFNREVLRDLSDRATTAKLELEAWAEGENIQFDTASRATLAERTAPPHTVEEVDDAEVHLLHAMCPATDANSQQLRNWLDHVRNTPDAYERVTRMFLTAIATLDAAEDALLVLLDSGLIDVHAQDDINERNALHEAVLAGRPLVFRALLDRAVDPARSDVYGRLPLHYAAMHGRTSMLRDLLDKDAGTIDVRDHANFTPLIHALVRDQLACVQALLDRNARVEPPDPVSTGAGAGAGDDDSDVAHVPLNLACKHASLAIIKLLLTHHARIRPDAEGLYPQHIVARAGRSAETLLLLRDSGADLDQRDK